MAVADRLYYRMTTLCPLCNELMPGEVRATEHGVLVSRQCPKHGRIDGLVCSDIGWYESLPKFDVPPVKPPHARTLTAKGCPQDCGLCPAHRQKAGTSAIEITNRCNNACPVCIADNQATFDLSPGQVMDIVEEAIRTQGSLDVVTLSGGEPTVHPHLFEILDALERSKVGRVAVNTNGIRIAKDDAFLERLAGYGKVYASIHYDGAGAKALRGTDQEMQERALDRLCQRGIGVVPVVLAARGVNDAELGAVVVRLLRHSPAVKSAILSLMAYTGHGGAAFPGDPRSRLTIPGALDAIEAGAGGVIAKRDFMPLPMPNPICAAIGYFLVDGTDVTPLIRYAGVDRVLAFTQNSHFAAADERAEQFFRETIDHVYAHAAADDVDVVLPRLKRFVKRLFPQGHALPPDARAKIVEESIKTVYLMQFMDAWTFDSHRLAKCSCQHLLPGGVRIPSCGYYAYHRRFDTRYAAVPNG